VIQSRHLYAFDRYFLPCILGLAMVVAIFLQSRPSLNRRRLGASALLLFPLAWFTLAGLHDQFRWQDARWDLYRSIRATGVSKLSIDGGYEIQGSEAYDAFKAKLQSPDCIGTCHCRRAWYCHDDSWHIGMNLGKGYQTIRQIQPNYWLTDGPPVLLNRRLAPDEGESQGED
jgi:hypothetical protein